MKVQTMPLTPWDPWRELERIRSETDRLWDRFLSKLSPTEPERDPISFLPDADFVETPGQYRLYLSIPGLIEEDIDISLGERTLTVRGERQPPYDPHRMSGPIREWRYGFFERRFQFPTSVQTSTLQASYEAGVLTIVVDKG
jgi:HSP20 family protein